MVTAIFQGIESVKYIKYKATVLSTERKTVYGNQLTVSCKREYGARKRSRVGESVLPLGVGCEVRS